MKSVPKNQMLKLPRESGESNKEQQYHHQQQSTW